MRLSKNNIIVLKSFVAVFMILGAKILLAQHPVIIASSKYSINYAKHKGYLILKDGQRKSGTFEYGEMEFPGYNLKYYSSVGKLLGRIKMSNIQKAVFSGSDTSLLIYDSTYFVHLKDIHHLFRKLTYGPVEVYDNLFNVDEAQGLVNDDLIVIIDYKIYESHSAKDLLSLLKKSDYPILNSDTSSLQQIIRNINDKFLRK